MPQIGGIFIASGVVAGLMSGMKGDEICEAFYEGCKDVLLGALIVGVARGVGAVSYTHLLYLHDMIGQGTVMPTRSAWDTGHLKDGSAIWHSHCAHYTII